MTITSDQHDVSTRLIALAAAIGAPAPRVAPIRRWVQSPNAGDLSGLVWGAAPPEIVLVHELGGSSNDWDAVALSLGRPAVALDLPGHGRSSSAAAITSPAKAAPALLDAVRSLSPNVRLTVAQGYGAAAALQVSLKRPSAIGSLLIVDGRRDRATHRAPAVESVEAALAALRDDRPHRDPALLADLADELTTVGANGFEWRYLLGEPGIEVDGWRSVERFGAPSVPVAVVTAAGEPVDPLVRSILDRWPDTPRITVETDQPDDLTGAAPTALSAAIEAHFNQLPARSGAHDTLHGGRS